MVNKAVHLRTGLKRVVKTYLRNEFNMKMAITEINSLKKLDHPNIIKVFEYFMDNHQIYIILEQFDGT